MPKKLKLEWLYEDLYDLLKPTPLKKKKNLIFTIGDLNEKVGSQEIPRRTGRFDLVIQVNQGNG